MDLDLAAIKRCIECRGCEHDCPSFKYIEGYNPTVVNIDIINGDTEKWIGSKMVWQCLECHTCSEMCPQTYSWETVFTKLKAEAMKRKVAPKSVLKGISAFAKTGKLMEPRLSAREKFGLPSIAPDGGEDIRMLLSRWD
jgi:heterodisulfide reductase subunit C